MDSIGVLGTVTRINYRCIRNRLIGVSGTRPPLQPFKNAALKNRNARARLLTLNLLTHSPVDNLNSISAAVLGHPCGVPPTLRVGSPSGHKVQAKLARETAHSRWPENTVCQNKKVCLAEVGTPWFRRKRLPHRSTPRAAYALRAFLQNRVHNVHRDQDEAYDAQFELRPAEQKKRLERNTAPLTTQPLNPTLSTQPPTSITHPNLFFHLHPLRIHTLSRAR